MEVVDTPTPDRIPARHRMLAGVAAGLADLVGRRRVAVRILSGHPCARSTGGVALLVYVTMASVSTEEEDAADSGRAGGRVRRTAHRPGGRSANDSPTSPRGRGGRPAVGAAVAGAAAACWSVCPGSLLPCLPPGPRYVPTSTSNSAAWPAALIVLGVIVLLGRFRSPPRPRHEAAAPDEVQPRRHAHRRRMADRLVVFLSARPPIQLGPGLADVRDPVGVASAVSTLSGWQPTARFAGTPAYPAGGLIAVGVVLLLATGAGWAAIPAHSSRPGGRGVWSSSGRGSSSGPSPGWLGAGRGADAAARRSDRGEVKIRFGGGNLTTRPATSGYLVDGEFRGGVRHKVIGRGQVELEQDTANGLPSLDRRDRVDGRPDRRGAARPDTRDRGDEDGPRPGRAAGPQHRPQERGERNTRPAAAGCRGHDRQDRDRGRLTRDRGSSGRCRPDPEPDGTRQQPDRRDPLPRFGDVYKSPNFATAANRVEIDVRGGVGSLKVTSGA